MKCAVRHYLGPECVLLETVVRALVLQMRGDQRKRSTAGRHEKTNLGDMPSSVSHPIPTGEHVESIKLLRSFTPASRPTRSSSSGSCLCYAGGPAPSFGEGHSSPSSCTGSKESRTRNATPRRRDGAIGGVVHWPSEEKTGEGVNSQGQQARESKRSRRVGPNSPHGEAFALFWKRKYGVDGRNLLRNS